MVSAYFGHGDFVSIEFLPDGQKYNSLFFTETISPSIERKLAECRQKLQTIVAHLHIDNMRPHMFKISIEKIEELGFIKVPHSSYSPNIVPCDFFLFGYLKHKLEGKIFRSEAEVISTIRQVLCTVIGK